MWKPGDIVLWRGIFNDRVWHAQPTILIKDSPDELVLALLPETECIADENYPKGKKASKRRWEFLNNEWNLVRYIWRTNRLLLILEPERYYSTILFWNHENDEFLCYYINFQTPFKKNHDAIDTLDLDLDIVIHPDFSFEWKDVEDYQKAVDYGAILAEWIAGIEDAKPEIFGRLAKHHYPFDGSWLDWKPDPSWLPPKLPENWDKI